jgi:hypothetical protein
MRAQLPADVLTCVCVWPQQTMQQHCQGGGRLQSVVLALCRSVQGSGRVQWQPEVLPEVSAVACVPGNADCKVPQHGLMYTLS